MARISAVLTHPNRHAIEQDIIAGLPVRAIAEKHRGIGYNALQRYKTSLKALILKARVREAISASNVISDATKDNPENRATGDRLLSAIARKQSRLENRAEQCATDPSFSDLRGWASIEGQHTAALRLEAELTGRLSNPIQEHRHVHLVMLPQPAKPGAKPAITIEAE